MSAQTATKQNIEVNGVNVTALVDTVEAIKGNAQIAKFRFNATNKWIWGAHNRSTIKDFYGACKEDTSRREAFILDNDEPTVLLGEDKGANPVEYVLHALAGCMTTTMVYKAAVNGIKLEEVESEIEGDIDLRGLLDLSDEVRNGFESISIKFRVKVQGDDQGQLELLKELSQGSPVFDIVTSPVPVNVSIEQK